MKIFLILFFAFISQPLDELGSLVVGVQDGDTVTLRMTSTDPRARSRVGKNLRIRLLHVDCPERGFPYFILAKKYTSSLCFQKNVRIIHQNKFDKYGRLLAEIILPDGRNLNQELVKMGYAKHFKKYSTDARYAALEVNARVKKLGIWAED
jgi:micrococcal nuclease